MPDVSAREFLLLRPEDIRAALFELTHPESLITVRDAADREIAAVVLGVDKQTGTFFWRPRDYAGTHYASNAESALFAGTVFHFSATGYGGVRMHFRVPRPEAVRFDDGSSAWFSPLPDRMSKVQRRAMFRVLLATHPVKCTALWAGIGAPRPLAFTLRDISIEGVGLRIVAPPASLPQRGQMMEAVKLVFGDLGAVTVQLNVRNLYAVDHAPEPEMHVGATLANLSPRDEVWLQQMVWRLERTRTPRSDTLH